MHTESFELLPPERAPAARLGGQEGPRAMIDRPYHDYAVSALRELNRDLTSSQAQLEDQREDLAKRADSDIDDLRQLEGLVSDLRHQLAATDKELAARQRETRAVAGSAHPARGAPHPSGRTTNGWRRSPPSHIAAQRAFQPPLAGCTEGPAQAGLKRFSAGNSILTDFLAGAGPRHRSDLECNAHQTSRRSGGCRATRKCSLDASSLAGRV